MPELVPIPFASLLRRIYHENNRGEAIFDLPKRKFYFPSKEVNLFVASCGNLAANPVGPAAGPHTQLTQNIVLSWLAGARIIELKTVQIKDQLELTRPCIDMATIGYNTEWSQELRLDQSAREYVKASMIIQMLKHWLFNDKAPVAEKDLETIYDVSVGYDLAGIQSKPIRDWLRSMQDASAIIEELRKEIPAEFAQYRNLPFNTKISDSITLSTFHGTPANEIENICKFLLEEMGFHVVVKMNPPMLGKERLEHLLHEKLGYTDIEVNANAYKVNITFDDAVAMVKRLQTVASRGGKTIGVKFGNTLEVINKGTFLKDKVQYLSGQPLHILHLALVNEWRKHFGTDFPVSFSAGVDANNFADCVSIGMVPVTMCTDLLRPGGYGRLRQYLVNLELKMKSLGAKTIEEFIMKTYQAGVPGLVFSATPTPQLINEAVVANTTALLEKSIVNPRYHFAANNKSPRKVGSHLFLWDCLNCDKCIPVCPNDANFFFETDALETPYSNIEINKGQWKEIAGGIFTVKKTQQIGNFANACNDCGNCDVFCPEDGGPYIEKPRFFGSTESYQKTKNLDGFVFIPNGRHITLHGRIQKDEYELTLEEQKQEATFKTPLASIVTDWSKHSVNDVVIHNQTSSGQVDMQKYLVMATLMKGMLNTKSVNYVNIEINEFEVER